MFRTRTTLAAGLLLAVVAGGCAKRTPVEPPGGATTPKAVEGRRSAEMSAVAAVQGAASAEVAAHPELKKSGGFLSRINPWGKTVVSVPVPPTPPPAPTPPSPPPSTPAAVTPRAEPPIRTAAREASPVVVRERVASEIPYPTEREAEDATLKHAADRIAEKLRELDPPVEYRPTPAAVKNDYARRGSRVVRPPTEFEKAEIAKAGYAPDRVYVEYTVDVTADQVRELRTQARVGSGLRLVGVVVALALAGSLFLRLDAWSKGLLTSWLAVAAVALAGGVVAALVVV